MASQRTLSAREVEGLIADGQTIVIYDGHALRLDAWLHKHPGGVLPIRHMVGKDSTSEINAYHLAKTQRLMKAYRIARIELPWTNFTPPICGGTFRPYGGTVEEDTKPIADEEVDWSDSTLDSSMDLGTEYLVAAQEKLLGEGKLAPAVCIVGEKEKCSSLEVPSACSKRKRSARSVERTKTTSRLEGIAALEQMEIDGQLLAYPSLDGETQQAISKEYHALHERIKDEGFYTCRYSEYGRESIRYVVLFTISALFFRAGWYFCSAIFLGMFWQQIMFVAHDAGHRGITGNFVADTLIGIFVADFCCGLSLGWWKSSHNVHHLVTNMPEHDPDLQNVPLFSTSPSYLKTMLSTFYDFTFVWDGAADFMVQYQKYIYYPIMGLARFNLYFLSWCHLLSPRAANLGSASWTRPVEVLAMACYWFIYGYCIVWCTLPNWPMRFVFVLTSHIMTMLLHVQITLSHWGMPTADLGPGESFPQRQLRTTMDVDCPAWLDFLHGGLQFQAVHHLFPRVPRHNLRALQVLVREFCEKTGVKYQCYGFVEGNKIVIGRLDEVTKMAATLVQCQSHMSKTWESGLH